MTAKRKAESDSLLKRAKACLDVLSAANAGVEAREAVGRALALAKPSPQEVHDALCRGSIPTFLAWDATRDVEELRRAGVLTREQVLERERAQTRSFNVFAAQERCRTCGVLGLNIEERQVRRADEGTTLFWHCPNGHWGIRG